MHVVTRVTTRVCVSSPLGSRHHERAAAPAAGDCQLVMRVLNLWLSTEQFRAHNAYAPCCVENEREDLISADVISLRY
jgi:hypothetical protein